MATTTTTETSIIIKLHGDIRQALQASWAEILQTQQEKNRALIGVNDNNESLGELCRETTHLINWFDALMTANNDMLSEAKEAQLV